MKISQKNLLKFSHFFSQRQVFSVYVAFSQAFKSKKGRSFKHDALTHAVLFLFKMRFNLPDRALEVLFDIEHVTISRMLSRVLHLNLSVPHQAADAAWYIVDTSHIFAAKGCGKEHQTGYKSRKGIKIQVLIDDQNRLVDVRTGIHVRDHDHKIFKEKYKELADKLDKKLPILADKAYPGLRGFNVICPDKSNFKEKRCPIKDPAKKRVKIEHFFARLKVFKILQNAHIHVAKKAYMAQWLCLHQRNVRSFKLCMT